MKKPWKALTVVMVILAMLGTLGACKSEEEKLEDKLIDSIGSLEDILG